MDLVLVGSCLSRTFYKMSNKNLLAPVMIRKLIELQRQHEITIAHRKRERRTHTHTHTQLHTHISYTIQILICFKLFLHLLVLKHNYVSHVLTLNSTSELFTWLSNSCCCGFPAPSSGLEGGALGWPGAPPIPRSRATPPPPRSHL